MAQYVNGVLSAPQATAGESQGLLQWPGETDFSGPVGGDASDLSLVPDLDMSTPVLWQAFSEGQMDSQGRPVQRPSMPGISIPWLLIGGLAIAMLALRK